MKPILCSCHRFGPTRLFLPLLFFGLMLLGRADRLWAANLTAASSLATPNALPNGSFESPALPTSPGFQYTPSGTGWTLTGGAGISRNGTGFTSGNPSAPQGSQVLFLQNISSASLSIASTAGYYTFSFYAAQRGNMPSSQTFQLWVNGAAVQSFTPTSSAYTSFTSNPVLVGSGVQTIEFRGTNPLGTDNTALVDDIKVTRLQDLAISGFESPVLPASPGFAYTPTGGPWTFGGGTGLSRNGSGFTAGNPGAPEGNQVMFFQGLASASTTINVQRAAYYRFKFKAALRANNPTLPVAKNIRITIGSTIVGEFVIPSTSYTEMVSLAIYLPVGSQTLTLTGLNTLAGDHTGFVDDLRSEMLHDWQDAYVWGGTLPTAVDNLTIPSGSAVALHDNLSARTVTVSGALVAAQNKNVSVSTNYLMVMGAGSLLELGQELVPYTSAATFTLNAPLADTSINVMGMGNKFLGAMGGGTIHLHGANKISWTQLGANATVGSNVIQLKEAVNWSVGDTIVIVSSRLNWNEAEKKTITNITNGGTTLALNSTCAFPHIGVQKPYTNGTQSWTADLRAQVGLLSHNIRVQGDAASNTAGKGFGGHLMVMVNSQAFISGIELFNMGQKARLGRYPMHWHLLGNGGAGQYFKNSSVHLSYNRAVTIHGTDYATVENNFLYDHIGHGVFLENGSERFNQIRKNVCLLTKRPAAGQQLTPSDNELDEVQNRTPSSYWITNPQNYFENNVAAGTQGTGFWFALPVTPIGLAPSDPRYMTVTSLPMLTFKGNSAHSCMSGFDIFDRLDANHSIVRNGSWDDNGLHVMENCLWYANSLAVYTGIGDPAKAQNLIFRNNLFVENYVGSMLASFSIIENSVFVANSGENIYAGERYAYRVYDGAGQVRNSHFEGWNVGNANLLLNTGAATKHPNHLFSNNTKNPSSAVRIALENFDIPPADAHANHPGHPRYWSIVLRDVQGNLTGKANTSLVSNQPFLLVGDEYKDSNWTNAYRSDHRFVLSRLTYGVPFEQIPNIACTREKAGTATESVYYIKGYHEWHQLPFLVNESYQYTYAYEALPTVKTVTMNMEDATAGDFYIARFKDFGKLGGISLSSSQAGYSSRTSLANLQASTTSAYYLQSNGDLYIKAVATGKNQTFTINWSTNFAVPTLDTDGDQMSDVNEMNSIPIRNPLDAGDLAAEFATASNFEDWTGITNISNATVAGGKLTGSSINNGDAIITNSAYNFQADRVPHLFVNMKASAATAVQIFFATSTNPGYSGARVVTANYTTPGAFQTLTFDMNAHTDWNAIVTDLRLDPVSGVGIYFEIDWIRSRCQGADTDLDGVCNFQDICPNFDDHLIGTSCNDGNPLTFPDAWTSACTCGQGSFKTDAEVATLSAPTDALIIYPNPFFDQLNIDWGTAGQFQSARLLDLQGRILSETKIAIDAGHLTWNLNGQSLAAGIYFVQLIGEGKIVQRKLVKQ